ncbi:MAG: TIGR03545 family protein [Gammaproteobacteria bacterium]|nr:TIGR03545 family protein [Gammaproteobacteria bacterium]
MNLIRTKGLIILLSLALLSVLTLVLFSASISKMILQSQLSSLNGAEVNINEAAVAFNPLVIKLDKIQVTNNENPLENSLEISKAVLEVDTRSLLRGRFIVNELQLDNIQFATQRMQAGAVFVEEDQTQEEKTPETDAGNGFMGASSLTMPDMDELINKTGLDTENAFKAVNEKAKQTKVSWADIESRVSDKNKWDGYSSRYNTVKTNIKSGSAKEKLQALKDFKDLKNEVSDELREIKKDKDKLKKDSDELNILYAQAKKMPGKDLQKIKSSISLNSGGVANISRLLFSEEITGYIESARNVYKKIAPYVAADEASEEQIVRGQGRYVEFKDNDPQPGFLIKKAGFTARLPAGKFDGKARYIAFDQKINNKPAEIKLSGKDLIHSKSEIMSAVLDLRDKKAPRFAVNYDIDQRNIRQYEVSAGTSLPLVMETAMLDMRSKASLQSGKLSADVDARFKKVKFDSTKDPSDKSFSSLVTAAMLNISEFNINAELKGTLNKPDIKIDSDIDNKINKQLSASFAKIRKDYEDQLALKIKNKYAADIDSIEQSVAGLDDLKRSINTKQTDITEKLNKYKK